MAKFDIDQLLSELGVDAPDQSSTSGSNGRPSREESPKPEAPTDTITSNMTMVDLTGPDDHPPASRPTNRPGMSGATETRKGSAPPADSSPDHLHDAVASSEQQPSLSDTSALARSGDSMHDIYQPDAANDPTGLADLKSLLIQDGVLTRRELTAAETVIRQTPGMHLLDALIDQGVEEQPLLEAFARSTGLSFKRIEFEGPPDEICDGALVQRLSTDFCKDNRIIPLRMEGQRLMLGTARPEDVFTHDDVRRRLGAKSVKVVVIPGADIDGALDLFSEEAVEDLDVDSILGDIDEDDVQLQKAEQEEVDLEREAGESPVIRYVNYIIQTAAKEGASDIHIEPGEKALKVRFRIDGVLFEMMHPPAKMAAAIISRLKIMANLDISERRVPQDGRIRCLVNGRKLDLRMSTLPTNYGEKTVLRILDTRSINVGLDDLGFDEQTLTIWKHQIDQPHGIVLVTGPTGSGKTTTLYASLRQMDKKSLNVSTVEDPIEYHLEGITQTQTHEKIGMTFAKALKALLRQDPDIIMLGEIRDQETAQTAIQAALTGHLVLSTLHTNDAPSAITRLVNIGLEPFLIGAAVNATLAQRLVRKICQHCQRPASLTEEQHEFIEMQGMPVENIFEGAGCDKCRNTGYAGRVGIYELLVIDDHLRDIIARNPNVTEFRRMCVDRGMISLRHDGFRKVGQGLTTIAEVFRVTEATI